MVFGPLFEINGTWKLTEVLKHPVHVKRALSFGANYSTILPFGATYMGKILLKKYPDTDRDTP